MTDIDPHLLHDLLECFPESGELVWKPRPLKYFSSNGEKARWNGHYAGRPALTAKQVNGYLSGGILRRRFYTHRVIWAMVHGEWPADQIDHINGDRADNRIANLRSVSRIENNRNQKFKTNNTSGATGVHWYAANKKWGAFISGKHLGLFLKKEDAIAVRKAAEIELGYLQTPRRAG